MLVDVQIVQKTRTLDLAQLRVHEALTKMTILQRGNRLSITPVTPSEWRYIADELLGPVRA
jgi:predicted RNA-binding protein with PUA-like domain